MKPFHPLLLSALLLAPLAAQGSALPYLPKNTLMAASLPDITTSIAEFQAMPLAKMWAEPEVQTFVGDAVKMLRKQIDLGLAQAREQHKQGELPVDPDEVLKLRVESATLAVTKLAVKTTEEGLKQDIGLMAHFHFGASASAWLPLVRMGIDQLVAATEGEFERTDGKLDNETLISLKLKPDSANTSPDLHFVLLADGLLTGTDLDEVRETLAAMKAKTTMLGATADYQAGFASLDSKGAELELFLRPSGLVEFGLSAMQVAEDMGQLGGLAMDGVRRAVDALGLRKLGALSLTQSYTDGKAVNRGFIGASNVGATGATAAPARKVDMAMLKWVPKDAASFGTGSFDVEWLYGMLTKAIEAYGPEAAKEFQSALAASEKELGFSLRDDLLLAFGDHFAAWALPQASLNTPPETTILIKVKDDARVLKAIKGLVAMSNGLLELEEGEKRGIMVYQFSVNAEEIEGLGGMNPLEAYMPTFSFKNGYLVACFSPSDVKRAFARLDRKEDEPKGDIRGNKEFASIAASIPADVTYFNYIDWKATFEGYYQIATGLLGFIPMGEDVPLDMAQIPDSATLTKHLFPSVSYGRVDANGTVTTSISPIGPEVYLLGVAIGIGFGSFVISMRGF
ncbi:MAG: hypothetical protein FJ306_04270 [Planctomycetes bacterium]|nr:hypothetical protein [Planctomycetota bacterium]